MKEGKTPHNVDVSKELSDAANKLDLVHETLKSPKVNAAAEFMEGLTIVTLEVCNSIFDIKEALYGEREARS